MPTNGAKFVAVIPFISAGASVGAMVLTLSDWPEGTELLETPISNTDGPLLTERQSVVLGFMAEGLTNAQIAMQLMLSESSIRQETVKIYRALGVNSRVEASKKGQALGLIGR